MNDDDAPGKGAMLLGIMQLLVLYILSVSVMPVRVELPELFTTNLKKTFELKVTLGPGTVLA